MGTDPFQTKTDDPSETNALQSSLWELHALEKHYYADVVTMAKSIGLEGNAPYYDLDMFLDISYTSLGEKENKKRRVDASITFIKPDGLFEKNDVLSKVLSLPS